MKVPDHEPKFNHKARYTHKDMAQQRQDNYHPWMYSGAITVPWIGEIKDDIAPRLTEHNTDGADIATFFIYQDERRSEKQGKGMPGPAGGRKDLLCGP